MTKHRTVTCRISDELDGMLDALAIERDRSKSYLVREALNAYLDKYFRDYRDKHIRESIKKGKSDD